MFGYKQSRFAISFHALALLLGLQGCVSLSDPPRLFTVDEERIALRTQIGTPNFYYGAANSADYLKLLESEKFAYRNDVITARMYSIDIAYTQYESDLIKEKRTEELLAAAAALGLTTAATLVGANQTKTILSAAAGAVIGLDRAYDEQVLMNKTLQILQSQMRSNRDKVARRIILGMQYATPQYTLATAMSDLEEYYRAGTIAGAMVDITNIIGVDATAAKASKEAVMVSYGIANDADAIALKAFLYPNGFPSGGINKKNQKALDDLRKSLRISYPLPVIIDSPELVVQRRLLAEELRKLK